MSDELIDLDVIVFMLNDQGKLLSPQHIIFYNQLISPDGSIQHNGDNFTKMNIKNSETVDIQLADISNEIQKLLFIITIHDAIKKEQRFEQILNTNIHIIDKADNKQIFHHFYPQNYADAVSMIAGELCRYQEDWIFKIVGKGTKMDFADLCIQYGIC